MVTSSNCCVGGTICGANVPIGAVKNVILVDKAYNSRVGNGPFPTEVSSSFDINNPLEGDTIRELVMNMVLQLIDHDVVDGWIQ